MLTAKILKQHSYHKFCHRVSVVNEDLNGNQACSKVGGRGGAAAPPDFGESVNPISTRGDTLSPPSTTCPPGFLTLAACLLFIYF